MSVIASAIFSHSCDRSLREAALRSRFARLGRWLRRFLPWSADSAGNTAAFPAARRQFG